MDSLIIFGSKYLYLVAVIIFVIFFLRLSKEKRVGIFIFSIFNFLVAYFTALLAGYLYNNPRPFVSDHITPLISHVANNGFPSDHTLLVATIAAILYCYNRKLGFVVFAISILIGASRVFAGIHHWIDIAGSLGIAIVVTALIHRLLRKRLFI